MTEKKTININFLRTIALTIAAIGAVGSLYFMFNASRNQNSILLITLFTGWVLAPFIGFFVANKISNRWTLRTRSNLCWLTIFLSVCSLVIYSGTLMPPKTKLTFMFLVVPLISLLFIVITILIARKSAEKKQRI